MGGIGKQGAGLIAWTGDVAYDVYLVLASVGGGILWGYIIYSGVGWKGKRRL